MQRRRRLAVHADPRDPAYTLLYFVAAANPIVALPAVMGTIAVVATIPGWSRYSSLKTAVKRGNAGGEVGRFWVPLSHVVDVK